ncbi:glycoside hydrolase [Gyrodon lividus]|nr:glycoside hydrolase [Gyrodon lividus]
MPLWTGSWFVLERWITDTPFRYAAAPGQSDLDVAKGSHAKETLERHWDSWITGKDFEWLASRGINAVRIPGLEEIFQGAWPRLVKAVETAQLHGIGILFDLHSAPGKQNQDSHSGTSSPRVSFFGNRSNLKLTIRVLHTLVSAIRSLRSEHDPPIKNVIGIELTDNSTPVAQHSASLTDPNTSTPQTFARVAGMLEDAGGGLVVGEWSGALNPGSLHGPINEHEERKRYIAAQLNLFERHCAGWFFWTYKKQQPGDQGWSFRDAVEADVFPNFVGMHPTKNVPVDDTDRVGRKGAALSRAVGQHASYWAQYPGHYEHWRFEKGYNQGWGDAYQFLLNKAITKDAVCELGFKGSWRKKRVHEHGTESGFSNNVWEYEHGFEQAIRDANLDFQDTYC